MDPKELRGLVEAYQQIYAPQEEIEEAVKGESSERRKDLAAERRAGIKPLSAKEGERYASHKMAQMAYAKRKRMGEEVEEVDEATNDPIDVDFKMQRLPNNKTPKPTPRDAAAIADALKLRARARDKASKKIDEAVKGADPEMRRAAAAERKAGDKPLSKKVGDAHAANMARKIRFSDKVTKAKGHIPGYTYAEDVEQVDELYKGKHGQSETEYQDSRSNAGKMVSGTSKLSGAAYSSRGVKNSGPNPAGGSQRPQAQGRMTSGQRTELQYRKANLKKEDVDIFDIVLEYLQTEGYENPEQMMTQLSFEEIDEILEGIGTKLAAAGLAGIMGAGMMNAQNSVIAKRQYPGGPLERDKTELVSKADKAKKDAEERRQAELYAQGRVDQARRSGIIK